MNEPTNATTIIQRFLKGATETVGGFSRHGVSGQIIEPSASIPLRPPVARYPADLEFDEEYSGGPTFVMRVPDGYVDPATGFVFDTQRRFIRESAMVQKYADQAAALFPTYDFESAFHVRSGTVQVVSNQRPGNYCRWWLDTMSKYFLFDRFSSEVEQGLPVGTLTPPLAKPFHEATLELMGLVPGPTFEPGRLVRGDLLISAGMTFGGGQNISPMIGEFGAFVLDKCGLGHLIGKPATRKIYITREFTTMRRIVNEDALQAELRQRGFEIVALENLSLAEQMTVFAEADVIVSPHGAGLTNLIFCNAGALLVEIFPDVGVHSSAFRRIATHMDMDYAMYAGPSEPARGQKNLRNVNLSVDVAHLMAFCDSVLADGRPSRKADLA